MASSFQCCNRSVPEYKPQLDFQLARHSIILRPALKSQGISSTFPLFRLKYEAIVQQSLKAAALLLPVENVVGRFNFANPNRDVIIRPAKGSI